MHSYFSLYWGIFMDDKFHFCATCKNFIIKKNRDGRKKGFCSRLNLETSSKYKFKCWDPKNYEGINNKIKG